MDKPKYDTLPHIRITPPELLVCVLNPSPPDLLGEVPLPPDILNHPLPPDLLAHRLPLDLLAHPLPSDLLAHLLPPPATTPGALRDHMRSPAHWPVQGLHPGAGGAEV